MARPWALRRGGGVWRSWGPKAPRTAKPKGGRQWRPPSGCRKSGLRHFFEVFIAPLRLRRGQGTMQRNPCCARLFADLPYTPPNPIIASGGQSRAPPVAGGARRKPSEQGSARKAPRPDAARPLRTALRPPNPRGFFDKLVSYGYRGSVATYGDKGSVAAYKDWSWIAPYGYTGSFVPYGWNGSVLRGGVSLRFRRGACPNPGYGSGARFVLWPFLCRWHKKTLPTGCRKSGLRHFFEVFIAPLRLRRGQGAMQGNPCYARLFADLPYTPPNPMKA